MRRGLGGAALAAFACVAVEFVGCAASSSSAGDAATDALDADAYAYVGWYGPDANPNFCSAFQQDARPPASSGAPHVDCFGGLECGEGTVTVGLYAPVYYCSYDALIADNPAGSFPVCAREGYHFRCPSQQCRASRYACRGGVSDVLAPPPHEVLLTHCEGGERATGAPCATDADCRPAVDLPDYALRCDQDGGTCVQTQRPPRAASFGLPCASATDCVRTEQSCGGQRRTAPCRLDEDCPAGFDCAANDALRCTGVCVPRGSRDALAVVPCAVFNADSNADASVDGD